MRLLNMEINNFRGISKCNVNFPNESRLLCMIGSGDSTKSTLLKAIEWVFYPTWNLTVCDNDFYCGDTQNPILIRCTFTEFPKDFLSEDKFGFYLRKPDVAIDETLDDEPDDASPICLTIQLQIDDSLEPIWSIVCNRMPSKVISHRERNKMVIGVVGSDCSKDMMWGRYSVLQKFTDAKDTLRKAYTQSLRSVAQNADLSSLDEIAANFNEVAQQYGVNFSGELHNRILFQNGSFITSVGVYDDNVPLSQRGLGSQRLLSMGLNINSFENGPILIIDEIETGLEPYRLKSLINEFRTKHNTSGQIIMTTHSPVVLAECQIQELLVVQSNSGITSVHKIVTDDPELNKSLQGQARMNADAFLCKRLIVCEGKTEIGFIRALDNYISDKYGYRIAHKGVGVALGGGENIFAYADTFRKCGYDICLFMDSDKSEEEAKKTQLKADYNISTFDWEIPYAIEEQIFKDVPDAMVQPLIDIAIDSKSVDGVAAKLRNNAIPFTKTDEDTLLISALSAEQKLQLGTIAKHKKSEWFKRIDLGEAIGTLIFANWEQIEDTTKLHITTEEIIRWVNHDRAGN